MGGMAEMSAALKTEALRELTGYTRDADIRRCLEKQGIVFFEGKDGPWTTEALIELAGRVKLGLVKPDEKGDYF